MEKWNEKLTRFFLYLFDGLQKKKKKLREYVEDTEDYINIMLDDKQNQLLQMGVVLSTAALMVSAAIVVTAVFGINIHIALYRIPSTPVFWEATGGMLGGAAALFAVAMVYYRKNGILR